MIKQGDGGRIINISSVHEDWPMPGNTAYCLSKGGMRMLTRTAGVELAPHGITVVGVGPGAVDTPIDTIDEEDPAKLKTLDNAIPLGRMARPDEDRQRGGVPRRRRIELRDRDDVDGRRRADHRAVQACGAHPASEARARAGTEKLLRRPRPATSRAGPTRTTT